MDYSGILSAASQLDIPLRIQLVQDLWDSIAETSDVLPPLSESQRAELERRLEAHAANPGRTISWEELKSEVLAKLART